MFFMTVYTTEREHKIITMADIHLLGSYPQLTQLPYTPLATLQPLDVHKITQLDCP